MPTRSRRSRPDGGIPSSSMADIAFLLLVFFLVTTVFPKDQGLAVVLPRADDVVDVSPRNLLQFVIDASGGVEVVRGADARGQRLPVSRVADVWREEVAANPHLIAVVRPHGNARYGAMVAVLDGLKQARAQRISLQMVSEGGPGTTR